MVEFFLYNEPSTRDICKALQSYHQYFSVAVQVVIMIIMMMRIYALYNRSRRVLAFFVGVAVGVLVVGCWLLVSSKSKHQPIDEVALVGCPAPLSRPEALRLGLGWGGILVLDSLVFALTVYKTWSLRKRSGVSLIHLLLRDGSIYFSVMIAATVGNILTFMHAKPFTRGVVTILMNSISSVMITRLMINLRDPVLERSNTTTTTTSFDHTTQIISTFVDLQDGIEFTDLDLTSNDYSRGSGDYGYPRNGGSAVTLLG